GEDGIFRATVERPAGTKITFKFVVDGEWVNASNYPTEADDEGNQNNFFVFPAVAAAHIPETVQAAVAPVVAAVAHIPEAVHKAIAPSASAAVAEPAAEEHAHAVANVISDAFVNNEEHQPALDVATKEIALEQVADAEEIAREEKIAAAPQEEALAHQLAAVVRDSVAEEAAPAIEPASEAHVQDTTREAAAPHDDMAHKLAAAVSQTAGAVGHTAVAATHAAAAVTSAVAHMISDAITGHDSQPEHQEQARAVESVAPVVEQHAVDESVVEEHAHAVANIVSDALANNEEHQPALDVATKEIALEHVADAEEIAREEKIAAAPQEEALAHQLAAVVAQADHQTTETPVAAASSIPETIREAVAPVVAAVAHIPEAVHQAVAPVVAEPVREEHAHAVANIVSDALVNDEEHQPALDIATKEIALEHVADAEEIAREEKIAAAPQEEALAHQLAAVVAQADHHATENPVAAASSIPETIREAVAPVVAAVAHIPEAVHEAIAPVVAEPAREEHAHAVANIVSDALVNNEEHQPALDVAAKEIALEHVADAEEIAREEKIAAAPQEEALAHQVAAVVEASNPVETVTSPIAAPVLEEPKMEPFSVPFTSSSESKESAPSAAPVAVLVPKDTLISEGTHTVVTEGGAGEAPVVAVSSTAPAAILVAGDKDTLVHETTHTTVTEGTVAPVAAASAPETTAQSPATSESIKKKHGIWKKIKAVFHK
ncbi:hypothetical protein HKX48_001193, partial [Thoreauomyces humboldtii]